MARPIFSGSIPALVVYGFNVGRQIVHGSAAIEHSAQRCVELLAEPR